jgi:hypothetical protein
MIIRWLRLRRICSELTGKQVELLASTTLPREMRAAVTVQGDNVSIAMNLAFAKSEAQVIRALSHEIAHVMLGSSDHTEKHEAMWDAMDERIKAMYKED